MAGYLARHHGNTLFVAKEEGLDRTLQEKQESVKHPCLYLTGTIPYDLEPFDFIFLDSISRLGLKPEYLRQLKEEYPYKNFIYVFQVTKGGQFRGRNDFMHDVGIVIELPQERKAVQRGRFNAGGEMDIF